MRALAYNCAKKFDIRFPPNWNEIKMAGKDWLTGFLKRNQQLSIRKPEATSLGRATSFNKTNVDSFFEKLAVAMDKNKFMEMKTNASVSCAWSHSLRVYRERSGYSALCAESGRMQSAHLVKNITMMFSFA